VVFGKPAGGGGTGAGLDSSRVGSDDEGEPSAVSGPLTATVFSDPDATLAMVKAGGSLARTFARAFCDGVGDGGGMRGGGGIRETKDCNCPGAGTVTGATGSSVGGGETGIDTGRMGGVEDTGIGTGAGIDTGMSDVVERAD
jgi:hypothetical protein